MTFARDALLLCEKVHVRPFQVGTLWQVCVRVKREGEIECIYGASPYVLKQQAAMQGPGERRRRPGAEESVAHSGSPTSAPTSRLYASC